MSTLYAGPHVGEFGWQLFCWQGFLREISKRYQKTIVACRVGHEILYHDFADKIMPQKIDCEEVDMWMCKKYVPYFTKIFGSTREPQDKWLEPNKPVLRYDHEHKLDHQPLFAKFYRQEFVYYGTPSEQKYDIIIHARTKSNKVNAGMDSKYRNWPIDDWARVAYRFKHLKIAFIGTKKGSGYLDGMGADLRGISLASLADVLAGSQMIVGPSSGPVHFAALCGCPQVTWYGEPYDIKNHNRFKEDWNPFDTPVEVMRYENWDPPFMVVIDQINKMLAQVQNSDVQSLTYLDD